VWVAGKELCDPSLTRAIPERFRDEYHTHYTALYKCPVYFTFLNVGTASHVPSISQGSVATRLRRGGIFNPL